MAFKTADLLSRRKRRLLIAFTLATGSIGVHATNWSTYNRSIALQAGTLHQDYREIDTQGWTADGTLDTERGDVGDWNLQGRWQGLLGPVPLWLQANAARAQGQTQYDGYLQSGSTLTPYRAKTGNAWRNQRLALGVAMPIGESGAVQIIPHWQWATLEWRRNLVQYSEIYLRRSAGPGLLLQWAATDVLTLEASAVRRRQSSAKVSAPQLNFSASQTTGWETQMALSATLRLQAGWHVWAGAQTMFSRNGASAVQNGLQAPPHTERQTILGWGLGRHY